jgi:hypothetical protein
VVPPAGDGGVSASAEVIAACTPQMATVTIQQPNSGGGMVFRSMIPDPEATFRQIALKVCTTLYDMPGAVRRQNAITLVIQDPGNGVAATGGSRINFNAGYIAGLRGANVRYEIEGVIAHESVHLYQQFGGGLGFVEGMADAVRFKTGYFKITNRRRGGAWDAGYQTSGFFFAWLDDQYPPRFLIRLNAAQPKNAMTFLTLTGKSVDTLWADYQAAIP